MGGAAAGIGTPARPDMRAAPYDDVRMESGGEAGGSSGSRGGSGRGESARSGASGSGSRRASHGTHHRGGDSDEEDGGSAAPVPAPAPAPVAVAVPVAPAPAPPTDGGGVRGMSAPVFFKLLRAHVPAASLQRLMTTLAMHQHGTISRTDLMLQAATILRPSDADLRAVGLTPAPLDLLAAFDTYLHK